MDHDCLVYKIDNLVQSSLLSSLVLTQYKYHRLKSFGLDKRTNSCIRVNTRELDKELYTK